MNSAGAGAAIAALIAGWPLYSLVTSGDLEVSGALTRGGVVALGCAFGVSMLVRLALTYEAQEEAKRRQKLTELESLYDDMQDALPPAGTGANEPTDLSSQAPR